jgi:hypothetical protein
VRWKFFCGALAVFVLLWVCLGTIPGRNPVPSTLFIALSSVTVPEIPAKSAELVSAAPSADRGQTACDVLRAASAIAKPGVLPYVVSAICRADSDIAGSVVATAIELRPDDTPIFCEAALCAAPSQVEEIVFESCKASPPSCASVAVIAHTHLPTANDSILAGIVDALPDLTPYLYTARIQVGTNNFEALIDRTVDLANADSSAKAR